MDSPPSRRARTCRAPAAEAGHVAGGGAFGHELAFIVGEGGEDPGEHPPGGGWSS